MLEQIGGAGQEKLLSSKVLITVLPGETTCYRCIFGSVPPASALLTCSSLTTDFRRVSLNRNLKCPLCGRNPRIIDMRLHPRFEKAALTDQ